MPSDAQNSLFRLLSNIGSGIHPTSCPNSPPSPLQYFAHTRYSDVIEPIIKKEWKKQGNSTSEPSASFRESVLAIAFEALSDEERQVLGYEAHRTWLEQRKRYNDAIAELYGDSNADELRHLTTLSNCHSHFPIQVNTHDAKDSSTDNISLRDNDRSQVYLVGWGPY